MSEGFPEYNGRNRFPKKQPKGFCRGCRLPIDPELEPRAQTWHHACKKKFDPFHVKHAVRIRDGGKCVLCKCTTLDCREWERVRNNWEGGYQEHRDRIRVALGQREEYDHIIPHSEGGLFVLGNVQLLCASCHRSKTNEFLKNRAERRKASTDSKTVQRANATGRLPIVTNHSTHEDRNLSRDERVVNPYDVAISTRSPR